MSEKICCFTGHRKIPKATQAQLSALLLEEIEALILQGFTVFRTGGALGFDTLAAQAVLSLQEKFPHISLHLYLPFRGQADKWGRQERQTYNEILGQAAEVVYMAGVYFSGCMQMRNRALVKGAALCLAFCVEERGGTAFTVKHCKEEEIPVMNLAEKCSWDDKMEKN